MTHSFLLVPFTNVSMSLFLAGWCDGRNLHGWRGSQQR